MAVIMWRISWKSILSAVLMLFILLKIMLRRVRRLFSFISAHRYTASVVTSFVLAVLNILAYSGGCQRMKFFMDPVKLSHGHVPVFPKHFFHGPDISGVNMTISKLTLEKPDLLDTYFYSHNFHNSLSSPTIPVVHIVWCDTGPFTFSNYLATLAAFKVIRPSAVYLHLLREPDIDTDGYFQFLPDLLRDMPPLVTKTLQYTDSCSGGPEEKTMAYMHILGDVGGVVINGRTILAPVPALIGLMSNQISIATQEDATTDPLILTAEANVLTNIPTRYSLSTFLQSHSTKYYRCKTVRKFSVFKQNICVYIHEDIYPVVIFNGSSHFDHLARWISYGTSARLVSNPADNFIVPNIVHYIWLGQRELDFFAYLSVMSSIHILKAEVVYIHGDNKPTGDLWKEVEQNAQVKFIHRDFPGSVFGEPIKKFVSHASDYLRADILLRYGGVYSDWDVIFLKELPRSMRLHNTTANVDWPETGAFPDVLNLGVLISAPGAPFLRHFLESYRWYLDYHWSYNAIHMPYKVYEKQPQALNIDRHLQILCAVDVCHGTWLEGYNEEWVDHLNSRQIDWRTDAVAIHWTHPDPDEFTSKARLMASDSVAGEIGKYVLRQAKIIS